MRRCKWQGQLAFLCGAYALVHADRGLVSGLLKPIQAHFGLTDPQAGLLGSATTAGLMVGQLLCGLLSRHLDPVRAMGVGFFGLALAAYELSQADSLSRLLLCRALAGVSESALLTLALPVVHDAAPQHRRSMASSIYLGMPYLGTALGVLSSAPTPRWATGRILFACEAVVWVPLGVACVLRPRSFQAASAGSPEADTGAAEAAAAPRASRSGADGAGADADGGAAPVLPGWAALLSLSYMRFTLAVSAQMFFIRGVAVWGVTFAQEAIGIGYGAAHLWSSGLALLCGLGSTPLAGRLLDGRRRAAAAADPGCDVRPWEAAEGSAFVLALLSVPLGLAAGLVPRGLLVPYALNLGGCMLLCFTNMNLLNIGAMHTVPPAMRGAALGVMYFVENLVGETTASAAYGAVAGSCGHRAAFAMLVAGLVVSAAALGPAVIARRGWFGQRGRSTGPAP